MKHIISALIAILFSGAVFAQEPMKTTAEYNGQKYPCYITEYDLPPDETESVIKEQLKSEGFNASSSKGYLVYRNARLKDLSPDEPQDVFIKVERKSRKEKDKSLVTMIAAKSGQIPEDKVKGAKTVADVEMPANSASFINSFRNNAKVKAHDLAVDAQTDEVAKAEKKLKSLQDAQVKLEKKIKDYQDDLAGNKKDQEKQADEITKQKAALDQLKNQPVQQQ